MDDSKGRKDAKRKFTDLIRDYCSKSTIHGVQYVGDPERPLFEKFLWIIIFIFTSLCNFYLIWQTWVKWQESPVIVSFAETTTPVWQVPFPALTVCPKGITKSQNLKAGDVEINFVEKTKAAQSIFCNVNSDGYPKLLDEWTNQYLLDSAPDLVDTLIYCDNNYIEEECETMFHPILTDFGPCFTYNILSQSELFREPWSVKPYPKNLPKSKYWTLEEGYKRGSPLETYPARGLAAGSKSGVTFLLLGNISDHDIRCRGPVLGYTIIIHNSAELPSSKSKYISIPKDQEVLVWVDPVIMTTDIELKSYAADRRQCYFPDERYLKYFKVYTERNCELECIANFTLHKCGCVPVYMPNNGNDPICGGGSKNCANDATKEMQQRELSGNFDHDDQVCNCMPSCTSINYQTEVSQSDFDWKSTNEAHDNLEELDEGEFVSGVSVYFSNSHFTTSHRSELFGIVDFLSNCGGLLALFSGISFLSFLEIFYFATLRPCGNMKKKQQEEAENSNLLENTNFPQALND